MGGNEFTRMASAGAGIVLAVAQHLQQGAAIHRRLFSHRPEPRTTACRIGAQRWLRTAVPAIWYKAYGVDAVVVPGRDSPEFWQPHPFGHQFDGVFPVVWDERDTRIYAVPRPARTLAHVVPQRAVVSRVPAGLSDTAQIERYMAAVEGAAASSATFVWLQDSRARIHAILGANQVLSVQVTYHPGWKATAGARAVPISKDGLGQMILSPERPGDYDISLVYDGGWESKLCRTLSAIVLLLVALAVCRRGRTCPAPTAPG